MKYQPVLPPHNDNLSTQDPLREFFALMAGLALVVTVIYVLLGVVVDWAVDELSTETELEIYQSLRGGFEQTYQSEQSTRDREQNIQTLLAGLASCADLNYPLTISIEDAEQLNAFALPGGHIVLLSGLLSQVHSENSLAFVLAHEIAHFKHRDHLRSMGRGAVLLALMTMLGGGNSDIANVLAPVEQFRSAQFSQSTESSADATALAILNCHYGHVGGASDFFVTLAAYSKAQGLDFNFVLLHYFSSHPQIQQRIAAINQLAANKGYLNDGSKALIKLTH